jgi:transposase
LINEKIDGTQASIQLGLSVRQTKRIKAKVKKSGMDGVIHGNRGRESNHKIDEKEKVKILKIIKEKYVDFTSKLTHEKLVEHHGVSWHYTTTRRLRMVNGLSKVKKRKMKEHFTRRERKENYGEMIQFDGSYHDWFEGRCTDENLEKEQCLLLCVDDATSEPVATLGKNESMTEVFNFWKNYIENHGKPVSIYLDKFSTYKVNHKNADHDVEFRTQFQRAMDELGVSVIFANSPQAKGRVERMNSTLQDRLVKELRLAKIDNVKDANVFIRDVFMPKFKDKFNVKPKKSGNLHTALTSQEKKNLGNIFSRKTQRKVRNDFVIQYKSRYFQLGEIQKNVTIYKKDVIIVEEHLDGSIHLSKNCKYLNFEELSQKPTKEINVKLMAISPNKTSYTPPENHPWKQFRPSKKMQKQNKKIKEKTKF